VSANATADILTLTRTYDDAGRLAAISATRPSPLDPVSSFAYTLDARGRRISRTDLDGSRLDYTYNNRDELTGAVRSNQPAAAPFGEYPYSYAYEFDRIGNHLRQTKNGTEFRGRYNSLNELTEREIGGAVRVQGVVDGVLPIGVKVDGRDAQTQGVDADTAAFRGDSPLRPRQTGEKAISIVATDSNQPPKRTEAVRTVQLPAANPVRYTYDANGNMVSDGVWAYTWTTECRLVEIRNPQSKIQYVYDGEGRRRWRKTYTWDAQAEDWILAAETVFVYDGWNVIAEFSPQVSSLIPQRTYTWGLDLSQTLHGAGGVVGLLSITRHSTPDPSLFVAYDGNGNVVALADSSTGAVSAEYDYSPFGETLKATGPAAEGNPFRFSTKYLDELQVSGLSPQPSLYYYGYRYYAPGIGRWISRDPIGEAGGPGLHAFVAGAPCDRADPLGLAAAFPGDPGLPLPPPPPWLPWPPPPPWPLFPPPPVPPFLWPPPPALPPANYVTIVPPFTPKYRRTVGKCEIAIFYGHYWSDNSRTGLQRLQVTAHAECSHVAFIACGTAYAPNIPVPLPGFQPPTTTIGWYGDSGASGYIRRARDAARLAAKGFGGPPCCCESVRVTVEGIGTSWWADPDFDEQFDVVP
jgi:RHS repeat-associated protein